MNSRRKGAKNEKLSAEILAKWTGKKFARAETNNFIHQRNEDNSKGDIVCKTEGHYFPFCIECKSYTKIDFSHLLIPGVQSDILKFWKQVYTDAIRCKKVPLLMMRYNNLPKGFYFIAMDTMYYHSLPMIPRLDLQTTLSFWDKPSDTKLIIVKSTEFFQMPYKEIKKYTKTYLKNANNK